MLRMISGLFAGLFRRGGQTPTAVGEPGGGRVLVVGSLDRESVGRAFAMIESHDLRVERILMNPIDFGDMSRWRGDVSGVEGESLSDRLVLWGAEVFRSAAVPEGAVHFYAEAACPEAVVTLLVAGSPD